MLQITFTLIICLIGLLAMPLVAMMLYPVFKKYGNKKRNLKEFMRYIFN